APGQDPVRAAGHRPGHAVHHLSVRGPRAGAADAAAGPRGGSGGALAGRERLDDVLPRHPAQHQVGPAVRRAAVRRAGDGRVRRGVGGLGPHPRPDQHPAAAHRDPLQRVRQHRRVRGVLAAGGAGAGDAGVEVLVGVPPQRRPRLAQEACMSAFVPAARDDRRAPPATGAQGAAPTETLNVLLTQDPTLRTVHPATDPAPAAASAPRIGDDPAMDSRAHGVALRIESVAKRYGVTAALDHGDLHIAAGELVALLGPSGSGKTTLLRVVAGLLPADSGRVLFGDIDATQLSLRERNVGFVFQQYALFRHMTVAENIAFGLRSRPRRRRPDRDTIARRVDELLTLIQLPEHGARYPEQLSGGQKQRVALARALAIDPTVLLLDEPFGALDAKVRVELRRWLRRLHDQTGQTTVFVTHDQDEALELADRVVVLRDGRNEQAGTPPEIHDAPATAHVVDFIGRASVIDGHVANGVFAAEGQAASFDAAGIADGPARLYLRPHDALPAPPGEGLETRVVSVQHHAGRITLELALPGQPRNLELDLVPAPDADAPAPGDAIGVHVLRHRVYPA